MPLEAGTRLGPYEILAPLGAGGMGEVYRAKDMRLDRIVAVKVLPSHLSDNPDRRQRFEREARAVSSLNHPHICALYDVGQQDSAHGIVHYLVMEHLQGETLAGRLQRGALPAEEALPFALQIADALDKAHRQGVIHRDLKPGNIMLTKAGAKLLDFGLAKTGEGGRAGSAGLTAAPTATSPLTAEGAIVGTFQYMAPEQLEGEEADARSDIFSFGVVLYEAISGRKAFEGKTQASLAAAILKESPRPLAETQALTPPALERLVSTCLVKDPDERRQSMHDILLELRWIAAGGRSGAGEAAVSPPPAGGRRLRETIAWAAVAAGVLAAASAIFLPGLRTPARQPARFHAAMPPPEGSFFDYFHGPMALSPDGGRIVFVARDAEGERQLWLRAFDEPSARPLQGTGDAASPFWSPDGRSIGFFAEGNLKRIETAGGPPDVLCEADGRDGGTWSPEGVILFSRPPNSVIHRIPASGGKPEPVTTFDPTAGDFGHRSPWFLPDGRHFLYSARRGVGGANPLLVASLDGGKPKLLLEISSNAIYSPTGHLLYWRDGAVRAQPFDPERLEITGEPVAVAPGAHFEVDSGTAFFSASQNGTLAYHLGGSATTQTRLVLRDRRGAEVGTAGPPGNFYSPRFSRDGRRIAVDNSGIENNGDIWIYDPARPVTTRLTFDAADESSPVWSPAGDRVAFFTHKAGNRDLHIRPLSGPGGEEILLATDASEVPLDWSWDGQWIAFERAESSGSWQRDIWILSLADRQARSFQATPFQEDAAQFSPDGRWLAYDSDESGRHEVYVRPFPAGEGVWQISVDGGIVPRWRADGREMFYLAADGRLMSVPLAPGKDGVGAGAPVALFPANMRFGYGRHYDAAPDGQRFVINTWIVDAGSQPMSLMLNWAATQGQP